MLQGKKKKQSLHKARINASKTYFTFNFVFVCLFILDMGVAIPRFLALTWYLMQSGFGNVEIRAVSSGMENCFLTLNN